MAVLMVEGLIWFGGVILYAHTTHPKNRAGVYFFWSIVVALTALWILTLGGTAPPGLVRAGVSSLIFFALVILWAGLVDRIRLAAQPSLARRQAAGREL